MATNGDMLKPERLANPLLAWFDRVRHAREMPWRQTRDPYAIWLSETMLQQTQVETVKPYYARFLARFPNYALSGEPVRGGRGRFRGFLNIPCTIEA